MLFRSDVCCLAREGKGFSVQPGYPRIRLWPEAAHLIRGKAIKLTQGIAGWVASHNEPALVPDVNQDPRFFKAVDKQTGFVTRAIASVPIRIKDQVIGIIEVLNPIHGAFLPETLELMANLGSLAGTAIVHAQWVQDLQAAESRFAGLFEDSIDPILITDLDGVITDANRRADRKSVV